MLMISSEPEGQKCLCFHGVSILEGEDLHKQGEKM